MAHNLVAGVSGYLPGQLAQGGDLGMHDVSAFAANQMGVRVRLVAVVAIAAVTEAEFQHPPISLSSVTVL
jgi:hypothetical protein